MSAKRSEARKCNPTPGHAIAEVDHGPWHSKNVRTMDKPFRPDSGGCITADAHNASPKCGGRVQLVTSGIEYQPKCSFPRTTPKPCAECCGQHRGGLCGRAE